MKAILFDLDGVLVDSGPVHARAYREALRRIGIRFEGYSVVSGMKTKEAMPFLVRRANRRLSKAQLAELVAHKQAIAHRLLSRSLPLRRHGVKTIRRLARHFTLALVSSTSRPNVDLFLEKTRSRRLFSVILSGEDVARAKPAPDLYRKALRRLRLRSREALVVEDAVSGIQASRKLKIRTLALTGTHARSALLKAGAEKTFDDLKALARYVEHL